MSEASPDFSPRPVSPVAPSSLPPGRAKPAQKPGDANRGRVAIFDPMSIDAPPFPLDPPLEGVRIPVKEPHAAATAYSRNALRHRFPDAEVGDDLLIMFDEVGNPRRGRLAPDVFVALSVPRCGTLARYDVDVLGPPDFVLEVMSQDTWEHDIGRKLDCYQRLGVRECLLFDVTGEDLAGVGEDMWGFALTPERRQPLETCTLPNGERGVCSDVLGLVAYVSERTPPLTHRERLALTMRWHDPATAKDLPDYDEALAEAQAAQREAQALRADTQAARRSIAELEEQLRRLRDGP